MYSQFACLQYIAALLILTYISALCSLPCCNRYYFDKKQIAKSVEAFKLALDINPMYEGIWFTLGSRWL